MNISGSTNYQANRSIYSNAFCKFIDIKGWRALTLMGYCRLLKSPKVRKALTGIGIIDNDIDILINHMRAGLQKDKPQVFVAYIWSPGHTQSKTFYRKADGAFDNYKQTYFRKSKETASHLNKVITFINKEDPEAIVYIFGDHGPYISRRETFEEDRTFYVQDIFGVYGGIYPRYRCSSFFDTLNNKYFVTVAQGAHMIIKCLSGGESAFLKPEDYRLPKLIPKEHNRYENYLY